MANEEVLELQIRDNAADSATSLWYLARSLEKVKEALGRGLNLTATANGIEKLNKAINAGISEDSVARYERLAGILERIKDVGGIQLKGVKEAAKQMDISTGLEGVQQQAQDAMNGVSDAVDMGTVEVEQRVRDTVENAKDDIVSTAPEVNAMFDNILNGMSKIELKEMQLKALEDELRQGMESGTWSDKKIADWGLRIRNAREEVERLKAVSNDQNMGNGIKQIGDEAVHTHGRLGQIVEDFKRIVKYRIIRSIIKQITQAFVEGTKNVYFYSKAIGGDFAKSMDSAASSFLYLKNSLGAALSPVLQSLIPILNAVVDAVVWMLNIVNQLISVIAGKTTWTRALRVQTDAFEETKKSASGASKAVKELLADWDELNIIQSQNNNAGSGFNNNTPDYGAMFEEVELPHWLIEWGPVIKAILAGVLGATILPKIFDWVKKILGLFGTGTAAPLLSNILNKLFSGTGFPTMPDYTAAATQMGIFSGAAVLAAPACETIAAAMLQIEGILSGGTLLTTLMSLLGSILASALLGTSIKVKVDRKDFDKFKEDFDKLNEDSKRIDIAFDEDAFNLVEEQTEFVDEWVGSNAIKNVGIGFDMERLSDFMLKTDGIDDWCNTPSEKQYAISFTNDTYNRFIEQMNDIMDWTRIASRKAVIVGITPESYAEFTLQAKAISEWAGTEEHKKIVTDIEFNDNLDEFGIKANIVAESIKKISEIGNIVVRIAFDTISYALFMAKMAVIELWTNAKATKVIGINMDTITTALNRVDEWIRTPGEKIINIKFNTDGQSSPVSNVETPTVPDTKGDEWSVWDYLGANTNELANHLLGTDLPEEGFLPYLFNEFKNWIGIGGKDAKETISPEVQIDPEITVDAEALKQQVKESIKKAIENDGVISLEEKTALETMYGKELYNQVRQEIMREMNSGNYRNFSAENTDATNPLSRVKDLARQHIANMRSGQIATANVTGMDMGRIAVPYMGAYQKDENIEADMERGVRNGNEPQNDLIRSMISQLEALNRKQWTVNVNPSSAWGANNARSEEAYRRVTG